MAPEMAAHYITVESERNPVAREHFEATLPTESHALVAERASPIDRRSDIYLLGAMLYQVATGGPPHTGTSVSECLARAVRNNLVDQGSDNELVAIALKAMATDPADRYASVDQLQQAIREHQTHNQSIGLAAKAQEDLERAEKDGHYEQFQRAMFGFQEAADLWPENTRAVEGAQTAKLAYARCALGQNDFDLGLQLLDPNAAEEQALHERFVKGANERDTHARRIRFFRTAAAVCALLLIGGGLFFSFSMQQKNLELADTNEDLDEQRKEAEENAAIARSEEQKAKAARVEADQQRQGAELATKEAEKQRGFAVQRQAEAETAKREADASRTLAESREVIAQTGRFAATFSLAKTYIATNNANRAARQLETLKTQDDEFRKRQNGMADRSSLIDWEWYRLDYLCHPPDPRFGVTELQVQGGAAAMAATPDGLHLVVGTADGRVVLFRRGADEPGAELPVQAETFLALRAVAISPNGRWVAVGGAASGRQGTSFQLWDVQATPPTRVLEAAPNAPHATSRRQGADVFSIDFSADGRQVVAGCSEGIAVWVRHRDETWNPQPFERGLSGDYRSVRFVPSNPSKDDHVIRVAGVARYGLKNASHERAFLCEVARKEGDAGAKENSWKWEYKSLDLLAGVFNTIDVSPVDPHLVALGAADGSVVLWTWAEPSDQRPRDGRRERVILELFGHTRGVRDVAFSEAHGSDGRHTLVTASDDQSLIAWDLNRLGAVDRESVETQPAGVGRQSTLWKATRSRKIPPFRGHMAAVLACSCVTRPLDASEVDRQSLSEFDRDASDSKAELISAAADGRIRRWALDRYCDERVFVQNTKKMTCTAAAVYATESELRVAAAGADGQAKVWDATTGRLLAELSVGHERDAAVVPKAAVVDGEIRIVTCGSDGRMCIWDGKTGMPLSSQTVFEHAPNQQGLRFGTDGVVPFDVSPDGRYVATGEGSDRSRHVAATLWSVANGRQERSDLFKAYSRFAPTDRFWIPTKNLSFAGSAQTLLISTGQGRVYIWDQKADRASMVMGQSKPAEMGIFRTRDRQHDITIDRKHLRIWSSFEAGNRPGEPLRSVTLSGNVRAFDRAVASDEDLFLLLVGGPNGQETSSGAIELWDRKSLLDGQPVARRDGSFVTAAISPDGKNVLAMTADKNVLRWDPKEEQVHRLQGDIDRLSPDALLFADNRHFLTATSRANAVGRGERGWQGKLWKLTSGEEVHEEARLTSRSDIRDIRFSADGSVITTMSTDGAIRTWPIPGENESMAPSHLVPSRQVSDWTFDAVGELVVSPDGKLALSLSQTGEAMRIWNPETGEEISTINLPGKGFDAHLAGGRIAILTGKKSEPRVDQGVVRMWETRSGKLTESAGPPMQSPARRITLADGGQGVVLASAHASSEGNRGWVSIWRLAGDGTWSKETRISADGSRVATLAVSPSGRRLIVGERGGDIAVWRIDSDQSGNQELEKAQSGPLLTLRRHAAAIASIRFSNDEKHLVSTDVAGKAVFWPTSGWSQLEPNRPADLAVVGAPD